jgi:hypothetical protein
MVFLVVVVPALMMTRTLQGPLAFAKIRPLTTAQFFFAMAPRSDTFTETDFPAGIPAWRAMCFAAAPLPREIFG